MIRCDCHMHTEFSTDSEAPVRDMVEAALAEGLTEICITDHYDKDYPPVPDVEGTAFLFDPEDYFPALAEVREEYAGRIAVRTGIEIGSSLIWADFTVTLSLNTPSTLSSALSI